MVAALTGSMVVRFADTTLVTQAINGSPCELKFAYDLGANAKFEFTAHAVYLPQPRLPIEGPGGCRPRLPGRQRAPQAPPGSAPPFSPIQWPRTDHAPHLLPD